MRQSKYPAGWDEQRVRRVLEHYEAQSDEEAVAEDEAAYEATTHHDGSAGRARTACPGAYREAERRLNRSGHRFRRTERAKPARPRRPAG